MFIESFKVESPNVKYSEDEIHSVYDYDTTELVHEEKNGAYQWVVRPKTVKYEFKTQTNVPKLGVMLVGWGGNNGSTLTAGVIANREGISWATKDKVQQANYFGSLTQASTIRVGSFNGEEIYAPFKSLLPMVNPDDIVFGGWDISSMNLADAMARARVLDIDLQKQLRPYMESMVPLPGIFDPDFIAANQGSRAAKHTLKQTHTFISNQNIMQTLQEKAAEWSGVDHEDAFAIDQTNLYQKLGLQTFINLSTDFYTRVYEDEEEWFRSIFADSKKEDAIQNQYEFFVQRMGGPPLFSQRRGHPALIGRHRPFDVTHKAAERWLHHMQQALDNATDIDQDSKTRMLNFFRHTAYFLVAGNDLKNPSQGAPPCKHAANKTAPE